MRRRPGQDSDPMGVVGWVFADMMIILVLVFVGTQLGDPNAGADLIAPTTTTLAPTTTTTTTPPQGIESGYVCVVIPGVAEGQLLTITDPDKTLSETRKRLTDETWPFSGRTLGYVITWVIAPTEQLSEANRLAEQFNEKILSQLLDLGLPGVSEIPSLALWKGRGRPGDVLLYIYFNTEAGLPDSALVPLGNKAAYEKPSTPGDCDVWKGPE